MKNTHLYSIRNRFVSLFTACLLLNLNTPAQVLTGTAKPAATGERCGSKLLLDRTDPAKISTFEQSMYAKALERGAGRTSTDTAQYTLPIVFHIVHQNGPENIPDSDIWDAFYLLNAAFKNSAPFSPGASVNTDIDFCLSASAITRHVSSFTDMVMESDDADLKLIGAWDAHSYINIWVVKSINSVTMGPGVAGYAMMPASHGSSIDGIVIEASFIHNNPDDVKVLVHEIGHYLGLYHTFEGGCGNTDCMLNGDRVCDTPPDNSTAPVSCPAIVNTCHTDSDDPSINNPFRSTSLGGLGDQPDMYANYMDYGFQSCQTTFTDGQRVRMRDALATARHSLLEHPGLCLGCPTPIIATLSLPDTLPAGVPATLTLATSATGVTVLWIYNGSSTAGSSITVTVPTEGSVPFLILVFDPSSPACNLVMRDTIFFTCPVPAPVITATPGGLFSPGETIVFTTPNNGYTYTWNVDGVPAGSGVSFTHVTGALGQVVTLEASNGTCKAASGSYYIDPSNCANSKENNTWYFGESGGINFNVSPPQAIIGKISTMEGSATISDVNGTPLFHSDGSTVGNSQTGVTLLNGTGLTGHTSTTQSALFVPMPGSNQYVYLFTLDCQAGDITSWGGGLYYSLIDRLGNSGQGEVTVKNQFLAGPLTEKLTAVKNLEGNGVWVIAHKWNNNAFYAWEITAAGISSPIVSNVGSVHTSGGPISSYYALGEMKASPSGKKIAVAMDGQNMLEVFDFDKGTGILSNAINIASPLITANYGVTFSPNERFVYESSIDGPLVRFDLDAGSAAAILASGETITSVIGQGGATQLAPDGKIYIARRQSLYLSVISNPNAATVAGCGYVQDGFRLADYTRSFFGLPNPVQSILLSVQPHITGPDKICLTGTPQTINYTFDPTGRATYSWMHSGPNAFTFINDSSANVTYTTAGIDTLIVKRMAPCGDIYDTLVIRSGVVPPFSIGPDQLVCPGTAVMLDAGAGMFDYNWSNGVRYQNNAVSTAGPVFVEVITMTGCVVRDTMLISNYTIPAFSLGRDTSICTAETLTLSAPAGMTSYLWSTGATGTSITVNDSGSYILTVGKFGCTFMDTIVVRKNLVPDMIAADTIVRCLISPGTYTALSGYDSYSWQLPSGAVVASPTVAIGDEGTYTLTFSNHCGTGNDSFYHYIPKIFSQDTVISCADTIRVITLLHIESINGLTPAYTSYIQHGDTIDFYRSGTYTVVSFYPDSTSMSCPLLQQITVLVDTALVRPAMSINLGADVSYCEGNVLPLNAGAGFDSYHWNTGSVDPSITAYGFGEYTVSAQLCGFIYSDTILISNNNNVTVNLGADITSCNPAAEILDAGSGYDWYAWSTGQTTQQITATAFGEYSVSTGLNGCVARDTLTITDCALSVPNRAEDCSKPFYLSPNPGTDVVTIGSRCPLINTVRVSVSGSDGKAIADKEGSLSAINVFMNNLMQGLSPAVYIVKITNANERYYFKWMIIK